MFVRKRRISYSSLITERLKCLDGNSWNYVYIHLSFKNYVFKMIELKYKILSVFLLKWDDYKQKENNLLKLM